MTPASVTPSTALNTTAEGLRRAASPRKQKTGSETDRHSNETVKNFSKPLLSATALTFRRDHASGGNSINSLHAART